MKLNPLIVEAIQSSLLSFDDEIEFNKSTTEQSKKSVANQIEYIKFINENFVDLGLPSGTLWCKYNLGATCGDTPESWYGGYYGLKKPRYRTDEFTNDIVEETYSKKYQEFENIPCMPSHEQMNEIYSKTTSKWVENYNGVRGLNGRIFTGKNGNSIFIPAAGCYSYERGDAGCYIGKYGYIWTKSDCKYEKNHVWDLMFDKDTILTVFSSHHYRNKASIRPVLKNNIF